jgi:apolipoprotein N-acyltransferase
MSVSTRNNPVATAPDRQADRLAWLWLLLGFVLLSVSAWQTIIPLAAWLAPVFLLRFARRAPRPRLTGLLLFAAYTAAILIGTRGTAPSDPWVLAFAIITTPLLRGVVYVLPYFADGQLGRRLGTWGRLLAFPLAYTTVDWVLSLLRLTNGNVGSLAYSQSAIPPLAQLASLTGMWGLIFLLTWFASTVNALWEQGFNWRALRAPLALFACALLATLGYGTARLLWPAPDQAPSVKVAAVTADHTAFAAAYGAINWGTFYQDTDAQRAALRPALAATVDPLLAQTDTALRGGAQLVSWGETAGLVLEEDKPAVIARAAALARQYHADVQIALGVLTRAKSLQFLRNQAILIDSTGAVVWTYDKSNPVVPNEALVVPFGTDVLPTVDRPFGRLGTVICQDIHYPRLLRQAAQGGATLVLDPSSDVSGLSDLDEGIASLRAIETGVTLVRPNGNGPTRIFDSWGRVLAEQADQPGGSRLLVATVPARHVWTLYGEVGDVFAYACVAGLIVLVGAAFVRRGQPAPQRPRQPVQRAA